MSSLPAEFAIHPIVGKTAFPSWAYVGYLPFYPFVLCGVVLLPARSRSAISRSRLVLDGLMVLTVLITFSWYCIIGPLMTQGGGTLFDTFFALAFPAGDILLSVCLLPLWAHGGERAMRRTVGVVALALIFTETGDSLLCMTPKDRRKWRSCTRQSW
jgi:hypothetical protein